MAHFSSINDQLTSLARECKADLSDITYTFIEVVRVHQTTLMNIEHELVDACNRGEIGCDDNYKLMKRINNAERYLCGVITNLEHERNFYLA